VEKADSGYRVDGLETPKLSSTLEKSDMSEKEPIISSFSSSVKRDAFSSTSFVAHPENEKDQISLSPPSVQDSPSLFLSDNPENKNESISSVSNSNSAKESSEKKDDSIISSLLPSFQKIPSASLSSFSSNPENKAIFSLQGTKKIFLSPEHECQYSMNCVAGCTVMCLEASLILFSGLASEISISDQRELIEIRDILSIGSSYKGDLHTGVDDIFPRVPRYNVF